MAEYLEYFVPGQAAALVSELRVFLIRKEAIGAVLLVTMLFFSTLAFTVLENALSVIFYHRAAATRRHFVVSALMPYVFIVFLALGLLLAPLPVAAADPTASPAPTAGSRWPPTGTRRRRRSPPDP